MNPYWKSRAGGSSVPPRPPYSSPCPAVVCEAQVLSQASPQCVLVPGQCPSGTIPDDPEPRPRSAVVDALGRGRQQRRTGAPLRKNSVFGSQSSRRGLGIASLVTTASANTELSSPKAGISQCPGAPAAAVPTPLGRGATATQLAQGWERDLHAEDRTLALQTNASAT